MGPFSPHSWPLAIFCFSGRFSHFLGARLRGRTATHRSKKGSEKVLGRVLGRVLGEVLRRVLRRVPAMGFAVNRVLRRGFPEGA